MSAGDTNTLAGAHAQINRLKAVITGLQNVVRERNLSLDALYYVWCNGGCAGGVWRFTDGPPVTEELVVEAERCVRRLREWWTNRKWGDAHDNALLETLAISLAPDEKLKVNGDEYVARVRWEGQKSIMSIEPVKK